MAEKRSKKQGRGRRWAGGYVWGEASGRELFIIEREVNGRRFHLSTRCHDERAAMEHLARFEADPLAYDPAGQERERELLLSVELISEFFEWQISKGNSTAYAKECVRKLRDWMVVLGKTDLRRATLRDHIKPALGRWSTSRKGRIIALKSFMAWLRKEKHLLTHAQDCTIDMPVPKSAPEKQVRRKAAEWGAVLDVYARLPEKFRDLLQLGVATGWHVTEMRRFIVDERSAIEAPPTRVFDDQGRPVLAVLRTWHKTKVWTRTSLVHQMHVDAARRLRESGSFVNETRMRLAIYDAIAKANEERAKEGLAPWPTFTLGVMRHSVATWALELGATAERAAAHLDHADKRTTERFYADVMVPKPNIQTRTLAEDGEPRTIN